MATNIIKLVLKGILFYATIIAVMLFIASVDNTSEGQLLIHMTIIAGAIYACTKVINKDELDTLLLVRYFSLEEMQEEDEW